MKRKLASADGVAGMGDVLATEPEVPAHARTPVKSRPPRKIHLRKAFLEPTPVEPSEDSSAADVNGRAVQEQLLLAKEAELSIREEALNTRARETEERALSLQREHQEARRAHEEECAQLRQRAYELERALIAQKLEATEGRAQHQRLLLELAEERRAHRELVTAHEEGLAALGEQWAESRNAAEARLEELQKRNDEQAAEILRLQGLIPRGIFQKIAAWF